MNEEKEVASFWNLLRESVIFQGILVLLLGIAYVYMLVTGMAIPTDFSQLMGVVVGFFFGGKVANAGRSAAQESLRSQLELAHAQRELAETMKGE